jgi:hypothetical protein
MQIHLLRARIAILVAKQAQQRTGEVLRHIDRRDRFLGIEIILPHHHAAAPLLHAGIDIFLLAGVEKGVPAARAGADQTDLAVVAGLRAHPLHRGFGIADHLCVGNAAFRAHLGGHIVRIGLAAALALIKIGADREIAVMREPAGRFDIQLAPARQMVNKYHARMRAGAGGPRHISRNRRSVVAFQRHVLAGHASVERHRISFMVVGFEILIG